MFSAWPGKVFLMMVAKSSLNLISRPGISPGKTPVKWPEFFLCFLGGGLEKLNGQCRYCRQCRNGHLRMVRTFTDDWHKAMYWGIFGVHGSLASCALSVFVRSSGPFWSVSLCSHPVLCIIGGSRGRSPTADHIGAARLPLAGAACKKKREETFSVSSRMFNTYYSLYCTVRMAFTSASSLSIRR